MKRFWKISTRVIGGLIVVFLACLGLLIYPGILFANSAQYNSLTIYSNSDLSGAERVLQDIERALEESEIHDESLSHAIFLGDGNEPFALLQDFTTGLVSRAVGRQGSSPSYNLSVPPYVSQSITFYRADFQTNSLVHPDGSDRVNQDLTRTLTHEVVHTLIRRELGLKGVATTPMWKQEGYADYVAASTTILSDPNYDISASVDRILRQDLSWLIEGPGTYRPMTYRCLRDGVLEDEQGRRWNTCYYISRVLLAAGAA